MSDAIAPTPTLHLRHVVRALGSGIHLTLALQQFWEWVNGPDTLEGSTLRGEWRDIPLVQRKDEKRG